jgi:hypothetical protein
MGHQKIETTIDAPWVDVVAVFQMRPVSWLRGFLRLAVLSSVRTCSGPQIGQPWFRLGAPTPTQESSSASVVLKLTWWPHVEQAELFSRFVGYLTVVSAGSATMLGVEGDSEGGSDAVTAAVLSRLLALITAAITADQSAEG